MEEDSKICPKCSEKNNPEFDECWKCQHSFLPWDKRVLFWVAGIPLRLLLLVWHVMRLVGFLLFVGLCLFSWGLISNVVLGKMTTGQYVHKTYVGLQQNKRTIQQAIKSEWPGPILETVNRIMRIGGNVPARKYFGNGRLKSEIPYKNGKREGMAKVYYENGRVRAKGLYKDGKLVGKVKEYYENGFLKT